MESPYGQHMKSSLWDAQDVFETLVALPGEEREKTLNIILYFSTLLSKKSYD